MESKVLDDTEQLARIKLDSRNILMRINTEIVAEQESPQALWASLRSLIVGETVCVRPGLLHDVIDFCLAVYDSLEPNASSYERDRRIVNAGTLAISLNLQIGGVFNVLCKKDNAFIVKWNIVTSVSMLATRQRVKDFMALVSVFELFTTELQQVEHEELVASVWLYSLYSAIFSLAHGTIPAGVLGIASFGVSLYRIGNDAIYQEGSEITAHDVLPQK